MHWEKFGGAGFYFGVEIVGGDRSVSVEYDIEYDTFPGEFYVGAAAIESDVRELAVDLVRFDLINEYAV